MNSQNASASSFPPVHRALLHLTTCAAFLMGSALAASDVFIIGKPRRLDDEKVFRSLEEESRRALLTMDYATLERLWSERFVVNTPGNFVSPSRAAVFELFKQGYGGGYASSEKTIECIIFDGDLGIVMGADTVVSKGAPGNEYWGRQGARRSCDSETVNTNPRK